jgi:integrase
MADLKGKAVIVQIDNELISCGNTLRLAFEPEKRRGCSEESSLTSVLIANGENVRVVQELMRHASSRFTLEVYTQANVQAQGGWYSETTRIIYTQSLSCR